MEAASPRPPSSQESDQAGSRPVAATETVPLPSQSALSPTPGPLWEWSTAADMDMKSGSSAAMDMTTTSDLIIAQLTVIPMPLGPTVESDQSSSSRFYSAPSSPGVGLTPISPGLVNFDFIDFDFGSSLGEGLTANLPWFRLLAEIEIQPGMAHKPIPRFRLLTAVTKCSRP